MVPDAHSLPNGLVIVFEGVDGTGKTTQLQAVKEALEKAGWPVLATRNMGGTPVGEALRDVLMSPELERPPLTDFYTSLAIQEPLLDVIDVARKEGKIILLDRGPLSLAAYQIYGGGIDETLGWQHVSSATDRIKPDVTLLYEMDSEAALARNQQHPEKASYFEHKPLEYFQKVAQGFQEAGQRYPVTNIDAAQSVEVIQQQTLAIVAKLLTA